jgi:RND family efflux transporter MFP subunit
LSKDLQIELKSAPIVEGSASGVPHPLVPARSYALVSLPDAKLARPAARPWRRRLVWVGLALAGVAGGWLAFAEPWGGGSEGVAVEVVAASTVTRVLAVNGRIAALQSVAVRSTVAGTLVDVLADEGNVVVQGAVLARLDDTPQQAVLREVVAALDQGVVAQQQAADAVSRAEALGANVSRVTLDDARRSLELADREVGRLRALVDQTRFHLTKFSIAAPIAGTVLTRSVDPGQVVDLTTPLFTVADLSALVVETDVDESYATQIKPGMPAVLQLTGETRTLDGTVSFVAPVVDAETGGLAVKIAFAEPQEAPVGLTVTANIIVDRQAAAISVPRSAIVDSGSGQWVFVITDGQARLVPVAVIEWPADRLIVTDGLRPGDQVIVDADGISDGQRVTVAGH